MRRTSLWEQVTSHIQVNSVAGYLSALIKGLANLRLSRVFINQQMLQAARQFMPLVGYGPNVVQKRPSGC